MTTTRLILTAEQADQLRHLPAGTRAAIRLDIEEGDEAWAAKMAEAKADADRKRSEAATEQHKVSNPRAGESSGSSLKSTTTIKENKTRKASAAAALATGANVGARKGMAAPPRRGIKESIRAFFKVRSGTWWPLSLRKIF